MEPTAAKRTEKPDIEPITTKPTEKPGIEPTITKPTENPDIEPTTNKPIYTSPTLCKITMLQCITMLHIAVVEVICLK